MSPVRGIPTSRAYWELKAEQVLNRVFEPEKPIEVEVSYFPSSAGFSNATQSQQLESIPVELQDLLAAPEPPSDRPERSGQSTRSRAASRISQTRAGGLGLVQHWMDQLGPRTSLLLTAAGVSVLVVSAGFMVVLGLWNQSEQAIRQERNLLLIERLRTMGPGTAADMPDATQTAATPAEAAKEGELPPPPPPGEPWMEELASLPASSTPSADVLRVPVSSRITSPAPAASASGVSAPQLVGVVQVPGQNGSAIFQIGGSSTSAAVGENIGGTGWRLHSASGDSAVIEKGDEQRRVSISSGF